jgi:hypothetical protein
VFGDDNGNVGNTPFVNSNSPKIKACKLFGVQGKLNKKLKRKTKQLSIGSFVIANIIHNFTHVVEDIEFKKWEMTKFITSQMLQSGKNRKKIMIQGVIDANAMGFI